jgi:hypothetical protein
VTFGLSARRWRMLRLEIGPIFSRLSLVIIAIGVRQLLPRVSRLHSIDATISELRLEVEDGGELLGEVSELQEVTALELMKIGRAHV